jgi:hypothetical protein
MQDDQQQIKLLSIFHYIVGGLTALFSCFPFIHIAMGIAILTGVFEDSNTGEAPPVFFGWLFVLFPSIFILCGWTLSACIIVAGRKLAKIKSHTYCIVIAALECMFMPFGTVLGVFTVIVLTRESVKNLFETNNINAPSDFT